MISLVLEPITLEADGCEINSTSEMLSRIDNINAKLSNGKIDAMSNVEQSQSFNAVESNCQVHVDLKMSSKSSKIKSVVENTSQSIVGHKSKLSKGDIRSFGKLGVKTASKPNRKEIELRIKSLK